MNKLMLTMVLVFALLSCNTKTTENNNAENAEKSVEVKQVTAHNEVEGAGNVVHLTSETFKQKVFNYTANQEWKYEGTVPCIVDFYADWCGPCKRVAPILDELAKEYDGKIVIYKVDTDKQQELASAFGIRSIPSILFVPASGQPQMAQGALPKESLVKAINEILLAQKTEG